MHLTTEKVKIATTEVKFCRNLKEHKVEITDCEKIEMILLIAEQNESFYNETNCHICKKETFLIRYKISKKIPAVLHNWTNNEYDFIKTELVEEF